MSEKKEYKFEYVMLGDSWQSWESDGGEMPAGFVLNWSAYDIGFGQLTFYRHGDKTECYTECMSPEFVKATLDHFFDSLVLVDK